jgi:L-iditol 2-dehydrogenase
MLTARPRLPSHVSLESAALLEPLSVAIHAARRATIEQGDTAIVFGAGTVGLLTAAMAKMSGATTVVIADIDSGRVNYALANGFAHKGYIVTPRRHLTETAEKFAVAKELAGDIMQMASLNDVDFEGADVTFDCTGKEVCMQAGLYVSSEETPAPENPADDLQRQQDPAASSSWSAWAPRYRPSRCRLRT